MTDPHFRVLERVPHYEGSFSGASVPYAIQLDLIHDPDEAHSGAGTPYVVNPIGHIKNLSWSTVGINGTDLRVIFIPAQHGCITDMNDFSFYVAGGITGLAVNGSVQAFNINGGPVTGVNAVITSN